MHDSHQIRRKYSTMTGLEKKSFNVPISEIQRQRLDRAAEIISHERGERITASALFRELGLKAVDEILADQPTTAAAS